ncbi:MAG: DEAD/DEAH box helicase, partial [Spirochaetaceae bacterium]
REERLHFGEPGREQLQVYESLRRKFKRSIEERVTQKGIDGARMYILEAMLRLRQAAILPSLVDPDYHSVPSVKLDQLEELVQTIRSEDNKALVFSQFTAVIDEVERRLTGSGSGGGPQCFRIDGSTPQRARGGQIDAFQNHEGSAVFLISLKAGGFGINLTAADYVILLDPWWNPAVEAQAIDRAHRIGRTGNVIAYRLITAGTIEEKMLRLQEHKRGLAESIIRSDAGGLTGLSTEDLEWLFDKS